MVPASFAKAQGHQVQKSSDPITLTLDEAVQIALISNYVLQGTRLDAAESRQNLRASASVLYPQISGQSNYTRNLKAANPFAGSAAGDLFSGFAFVGWLGYNEQARTDADPATIPITFAEYADRQQRGIDAANIIVETSDNPFVVDNQYTSSITITQKLVDVPGYLRLFGPKGARSALQALDRAADRQEQIVIGDVREAFYGVLLAQEEARVARQSVERTRQARNETAQRVAQGIIPKIQRLSMDVELANQETALVRARNEVDDALAGLKYLLGIPVEQPVRVHGTLAINDVSPYLTLATGDAYTRAIQVRPDLEQARLTYQYRLNEVKALRLDRMPLLDLFANFSYIGRVPDNRTFPVQDPNDPFKFSQGRNTYFSKSYWQSSVNVGFNLSWTLFDGLQRRSRVKTAQIAADRAALNMVQLEESIRLEVESALRTLAAARQQILSQETNVANAELNYEYARARSREGISSSLELRTASLQLDTSRLSYLQAIYSFLVAQSTVEIALGLPLSEQFDMDLAANP